MKRKRLLFLRKAILIFMGAFLFLGTKTFAQETLIGYWNFNEGASGSPWDAPINANAGEGAAQITEGTWTWGDTDFTEGFAGSTQNALFGDPAGASLSLRNESMNGNYIQIEFNLEGYVDLEISYWTRRTSTGFNSNQWSWSTDGQNFTDFGPVINPTESTGGEIIIIDAPSDIDDNSTVYLRYTLDGATSASGNNRIDNLQLNAAEDDPDQVATPTFDPAGGTYFEPQQVTLSTNTEGADIYYTLNGADPTEDDILFVDPIDVEEDVTIRARAFHDDLDPSNVATAEYKIRNLILEKDFEDEDLYSGGWMVYDYISGANSWEIDEFGGITYAMITEYDSDPPYPHSWYISPEIDLSGQGEVTFTFYNQTAFRTGDAFSVHISADYDGSGDPADATWTELDAELDPHTGGGFGSWTHSGDIDLSDYTGTVHIGFQYESDEDNIGRWHINDVLVLGAEPVESSDATLATFNVGGISVLNLGGLVVDDPETDPGALLHVDDFTDFAGIEVLPNHEMATYTVTLNGDPIDEEDLDDQPIEFEDVIVVTVTAEDQTTVKYYKVTAVGEDRVLTILTPTGDDVFYTYDEITFSWIAENLNQLVFEVYMQDVIDPIWTEVVDADLEEIVEEIPNGIHGFFKYRLTDLDDPSFYEESEYFEVIDNVEPSLLEKYPEAGATGVELQPELTLLFDEEFIYGAEGSIHLYRQHDDALIESIEAISEQVVIEHDLVTIFLADALDYETTYYVLIDNDAFVDMGDNYFEGIDDETFWTFTTMEDEIEELICNGDFENWTDGLPDCWYGEKSNIGQGNVNQYDADPHTGSYAVQLINTSGDHQRFTSQATSLESGIAYKITFWVKGKGDIRTGLFDDRETGFGYAPYNSYISVDSDSWSEHSQVVTAVNTTGIAEFIFSLRNTEEGMEHLQLDNVTVEVLSEDPIEVANIAELRAGEIGAVYTLTGEAILTFQQEYRNQKFIQDATAAIMIDDDGGNITTSYNRYDGITGITGTLGVHNQMLQFVPVEDPGPASSTDNEVIPQEVTLDALTSNHQAQLVVIHNVTFEESGTFETGTNYNLSSPDGSGIFRTSFFEVDYIGEPIPTQPQTLTVLVSQYLETIQVAARDLDDFEIYTSVTDLIMDKITVYPNPFDNYLRIADLKDISRIELINSEGQTVKTMEARDGDLQITTSGLRSGIYFIRLIGNDGTMNTKKLIKQ